MRRKKRTGKPENPADITDLEVARKMIKIFQSAQDRKLEFEDILHYQKIIVALFETDRLMKEIDKIEI